MTTTPAPGGNQATTLRSVPSAGESAAGLLPSSPASGLTAGGERPRTLSPSDIHHCAQALAALSGLLMVDEDFTKEISTILKIQLQEVVNHPETALRSPEKPVTAQVVELPPTAPLASSPSSQPSRRLGYDDFATLFEKFGRKPTDAMNRWFREVGGFDGASDEQRAEIYRKANEYYVNNPSSAPKGQAPPKCPACGSATATRQGKFGPFVGCTDYPTCRWIFKKPRQ